MQLQKLNKCFDQLNSELLLCVACLRPNNSFVAFNEEKLIWVIHFYSNDFSVVQFITLDNQLET